MFKLIMKMAVLTGLILFLANAYSMEDKLSAVTGISEAELRTIAVSPDETGAIFAGSVNKLYRSLDQGANWQEVFTVYGAGTLNFITIDKKNPALIYIATSNGLFKSVDSGDTWKRVFKGVGEEEKDARAVTVHPFDSNIIYAGTGKGLFTSKDGGMNWKKSTGEAGGCAINFILANPVKADAMYIATEKGVFKTNDMGKHWARVFVESQSNEGNEEDASNDEAEIEENEKRINCITIAPAGSNEIYIGTGYGVYESRNEGETWQKITSTGLSNSNINSIALSGKETVFIYAATDEGIFKFDREKQMWEKLYKGAATTKVNMLAFDSSGSNLWAAGDGGVFRTECEQIKFAEDKGEDRLPAIFADEPTIREIQEIAIKYAEVGQEKINSWRQGAKYRAVFPELSVNYDKTVTYDSGNDKYYIGPYDWGVSLKWDLADLIWNPYQKDIDVRSRLMVQLRDDVLDEVTQLYYERKRLQAELALDPPKDEKTKREKELRLQELTANIDSLTNGYLSKKLKKVE